MLTMTEKKRGRKPEENPLSIQVSIRLTPDLAARLDRYLKRSRPAPRRADVVRLALEDFLTAAKQDEGGDE